MVASLASLMSELSLDVLEEVADVAHEKERGNSPREEEKER